MARKSRHPVFAGKTPEGEEIVIYMETPRMSNDYVSFHQETLSVTKVELFIKLPNGEVWALGPKAVVTVREEDVQSTFATHISIESSVWTGTASGTREDLFKAERV